MAGCFWRSRGTFQRVIDAIDAIFPLSSIKSAVNLQNRARTKRYRILEVSLVFEKLGIGEGR